MIRLVSLFRRRADIDHAVFRKYWNAPEFNDLINGMVAFCGAEYSSKLLALQIEATENIRAWRGGIDPFDGVLEYYWSSAADVTERFAATKDGTEEPQLLADMHDYQVQFVDLDRSCIFFTSE